MSVSLLSILIALTLPALASARRAASSSACLATLASLGQGFQLIAGSNGGQWPNAFPRGNTDHGMSVWHPGESSVTGIAYLDQTQVWTTLLIGAVWDQGDPADPFRCPGRRAADDPTITAAGMRSYMYSAALITTPRLWAPGAEGEQRRLHEPERERAWVLTADVAHPADKVAMAEIADHHGGRRSLEDPAVDRVNALFADGHAARVAPRDAAPAMLVRPTPPAWRPTRPVPFSAAADGYLGRDY